jgi:hypothetical protein
MLWYCRSVRCLTSPQRNQYDFPVPAEGFTPDPSDFGTPKGVKAYSHSLCPMLLLGPVRLAQRGLQTQRPGGADHPGLVAIRHTPVTAAADAGQPDGPRCGPYMLWRRRRTGHGLHPACTTPRIIPCSVQPFNSPRPLNAEP